MKIVSIVGARPQFIKCAPVSRKLRKEQQEILVHTGQHYDANMSDVFFEELSIPKPDYNLNIGSGSQDEQTGKMLVEIEKVIQKEQPDMVLVYGDTNSTLAGALAAAKMHIPVAHVEAGLRSFDKSMPEEINRIMTDHVSDFLFCPTQTAVDNLAKEGITKGVYLTGDVMVDALQYNIEIAKEKSDILDRLLLMSGAKKIMTNSAGIQKEAYIVNVPCITLRENTEWVETIEDGFNILTGADKDKIISAVLDNKTDLSSNRNRFGNGDAAEKMIPRIFSFNN